ncbi:MAG: hypothetical protein Q7J85_12560 [Bacillota bacterium]|nr:hypothetical protein [Bacillota bacterium]
MEDNICQRCGTTIFPYEKTINLQSKPNAEIICSECFSKEMAMHAGMQLGAFTPQTIEINGRGRKNHLFYIK